jgi:hypothetical protein
MRDAYSILIGKSEWEEISISLGSDGVNIKMDFREIGRESMDWILVVQKMDQWWAVLKAVMNLQNFIKSGEFFIS